MHCDGMEVRIMNADAAESVGMLITAEQRCTAEPIDTVGVAIDAGKWCRSSPDVER